MGKFKFINTPIKDLVLIEPTVYGDDRGYFMETYHYNEFCEKGIDFNFVQDNQSKSKAGVLRGMHFQVKNPQGKLVRVISGSVYDVALDLRKNSDTFGKWYGLILSSDKKNQMYIPEGFAHGFLVLSETCEFVYKCTRFYDPNDEMGILYNDPTLNIDWNQHYFGDILVSEKDKNNQTFNEWINR